MKDLLIGIWKLNVEKSVSADGKSLLATTFGYDVQLRQFRQKMV